MKEQDLMKANNIAGTPDTPDIPLIELKPEKKTFLMKYYIIKKMTVKKKKKL